MVSLRRRLRTVQHAMDEATSWAEWRAAAAEHDRLTGLDAWRDDDEGEGYDAALLRDDLRGLRRLRAEGDVAGLADQLHEALTRHHGDLADPGLYGVAWAGTKRLVEDFMEEAATALEWIAAHPAPGVSDGERRRRLADAARNRGRTCLMLSGGGTLGWIHLGVVKALFEQDLLPRIMTGASMGAMIAAGICARTDAEIADVIAHPEQIRTYGLQPRGPRGSLAAGALLDPEVLLDTIRHNCGDLTFEEAHRRTGRVLNISVSPTRRGQRPRLLNHLTAPHLLIAESALASSAIPGVFPPATLVARGADGAVRTYLASERWVDGSMHGDLPKWRVARLFNVSHFIVSQTNPHVVPFLSDPRRRSLWRRVSTPAGVAVLQQGRFALSAAAHLTADTPLRPVTELAHSLASQDYRGDIDIHPAFAPGLLRKAFTNATDAELRRYILLGERAAWPHLARIRIETRIARVFERLLGEL